MPKIIAEVPVTEDEAAIILISLLVRQEHFPPASRNDRARLKSLIEQFRKITNSR